MASWPVCLISAAAGATTARALLGQRLPGGPVVWERTNHAGRVVSLLEGPAWAAGACSGLAVAGGPAAKAATGLVLASAALGALDDHLGSTSVKGLRGHLGALRRGRVTTGAVKLVALPVTGLLAAAALDAGYDAAPVARALRTTAGGAVVAAAADVVNLLDLRPGRALKAVVLAAPLAGASGGDAARLAATAAGASLAVLPEDLAGRGMLGDTGANAAGALLGAAVVAGGSTAVRAGALGILTWLVLASERVSFTQVIARTPWLDAVDRWGRAT